MANMTGRAIMLFGVMAAGMTWRSARQRRVSRSAAGIGERKWQLFGVIGINNDNNEQHRRQHLQLSGAGVVVFIFVTTMNDVSAITQHGPSTTSAVEHLARIDVTA